MRDQRTPPRALGARLALAAVALALFGLLSMHGWGSHAGRHPMETTPQSMGTAPQGATPLGPSAHHGHAAPYDAQGPVGDETAGSSAPGGGSRGPGGDEGAGLLGLCLAVLAGLVLGTALLLAGRGIRPPRSLLQAWPHPVLVGRDRDPPDLRDLCVIRC